MTFRRSLVNAAPKPFQGAWEGENKIVIGIDIGTTQSGVAFTFLQKGVDQLIHRVTQWPGQEAHNQQSKIPTLVWYDRNNEAVSFGAEAMAPRAQEDAEDNKWHLARYFKLHLHPDSMKAKHSLKLDALPPNVPLQTIYCDFVCYLLRHTKSFFEDRILDGKKIWKKYGPSLEVVIAHPNGWGIREQVFLRTVVVDTGFIDAATAGTRVRFVTEAEASVHFCIYHTNLGGCLQPGTSFAVCDAGGSTVDTTVYQVVAIHPELKIRETRASDCVQAGAIFVDAEIEKYFRAIFKKAKLGKDDIEDYVARGLKDFECGAKRAFRDTLQDQSVEIGGPRLSNTQLKIRRGRIALSGSTVETFFNPHVAEIMRSVDYQTQDSGVSYILLVGGFGESLFLRQELKRRYEAAGCEISTTNDSTSKAVADGAVIWSTTSSVTSRASRFSYGIETSIRYDSRSSEHRGRRTYVCASGQRQVSGCWGQIVEKGAILDSQEICRRPFQRTYSTPDPDLECFELSLLAYAGEKQEYWIRTKQNEMLLGFDGVCTIAADLTNLSGALAMGVGVHKVKYWYLNFDVCIQFGDTELLAYLEWKEDGVVHTGPATIVTDELV
ncbi:hypothetical protein BDV93DRAFT_553197 [Ceratobasidium sp. AG-I]|nr:hypothetical protein BDV93DRAFT_553197 [Ceratobasidium sp. AG-I]